MVAEILDYTLVTIGVVTAVLIFWKTIELFLPGIIRELRIEVRATSTEHLDELLERAERGLPLLATIAATAPFIGLAATVLHIMNALEMVGGTSVETTIIAGPIATALHSTLLGLASAVPAAAAYNLMARRLQLAENRARRALSRKAAGAETGGEA